MHSKEFNRPTGHNRRNGGRFELLYFEQNGSRTYLRFTGLALILIVGLTVVSVILLFALLLSNRHKVQENINVNVIGPRPAPHDYGKTIMQPASPASSSPKIIKQPEASVPVQQMLQSATGSNSRPSPASQIPSPTPARTPTRAGP